MEARHLRRLRDVRVIIGVIAVVGVALYALAGNSGREVPASGTLFDRVDAFVVSELDGSRIPGAAFAVVEGGRVVHARGFGADGTGRVVTADTPFWIGSNTKSVTALAIMQLVESGRVELDAPAQRYVPEFRVADPDASARMTVRQLLNQTSGLARSDSLRVVAAAEEQTIAETVADMRDLALNRPLGERFEYANLNSVVLGLIVERVTGLTWQEYVRASIFEPLEMRRTYTSIDEARANGLTGTHRNLFGYPLRTGGEHLDGLAPTGYVYASATDMARYLAMYLEGGTLNGTRVLSERGITEMLTGATNERTFPLQSQSFTARYGAGWFVGTFGGAEDARWHQGSLPHFAAWMVLLPETDQAVVVLMNAGNQFEIAGANRAWSRIPEGVVTILRGGTPPEGTRAAQFFVAFDTAVVIALVLQCWSLWQVLQSHVERPRGARVVWWLAPLTWELGLALLVLVGFPSLAGGLGWSATFQFLPDLSLVVLVVCGLWIATGVARLAVTWRRPASPGVFVGPIA